MEPSLLHTKDCIYKSNCRHYIIRGFCNFKHTEDELFDLREKNMRYNAQQQ